MSGILRKGIGFGYEEVRGCGFGYTQVRRELSQHNEQGHSKRREEKRENLMIPTTPGKHFPLLYTITSQRIASQVRYMHFRINVCIDRFGDLAYIHTRYPFIHSFNSSRLFGHRSYTHSFGFCSRIPYTHARTHR